jgi:hypothetical protein
METAKKEKTKISDENKNLLLVMVNRFNFLKYIKNTLVFE